MKNDTTTKIVRIKGNSMEPLLRDGDIAFVSAMQLYTVGDIVIFYYQVNGVEKILSHRIVYKDDYHLYCKGDNSLNLEEITLNAIIGKITSIERHGVKICISIRKDLLEKFCNLSKKCGDEWNAGNIQIAQVMATRCYINMLKVCKFLNNEENLPYVCLN